jgi:hypothetical protein
MPEELRRGTFARVSQFASNGNLVFTRHGWVYRYTYDDLRKGVPGFAADLNGLTREMTGAGK